MQEINQPRPSLLEFEQRRGQAAAVENRATACQHRRRTGNAMDGMMVATFLVADANFPYASKKGTQIMKSTRTFFLFALIIAASAANAQSACSNASLKGTYAMWDESQTAGTRTTAEVALLNFDGRGGLTAYGASSVNGVANRNQTWTGTYTVALNCAYSSTITDSSGSTAHPIGVISDAGRHGLGISNDQGTYASFEFVKMPTTQCTKLPAATITGIGHFLYTPFGLQGNYVAIGTGDGAGHTSATYQANLGAILTSGTVIGTNVIHPDCTFDGTGPDGGSTSFGIMLMASGHIESHQIDLQLGYTTTLATTATPIATR